jgi:DNA-binding LacI/PurR family transcriptional regulator
VHGFIRAMAERGIDIVPGAIAESDFRASAAITRRRGCSRRCSRARFSPATT